MIWRNFALAVWISILWAAWRLAWLVQHASAVTRFYGPFSPRVVFFPIVVGGGQLFLWFRIYRDRDARARWLAGMVAGFFVLQLLIMGLQATVQLRPNPVDAVLFGYFALSHALFAVKGDATYSRLEE